MKLTRIALALVSAMLVAQIAAAQMMGGGGGGYHGGTPSTGGVPFGGMTGARGNAGMGAGAGQLLTVGPDGVTYTLRTIAATTDVPASFELVAVRPTGTIAWATKIETRMTRVELAGDLVILATGNGEPGTGMHRWTSDDEVTSQLVAISATSGSVQWTLALDGFPIAIEPFSGGIYALVADHDAAYQPGTGTQNRALLAIDPSGKVLWTLELN